MQEIIGQLLDYLRGIWRNRWYAMVCAWIICLIGWAVVYRMPDQYQASARVFVDTQSVLRPLLQGLAVTVNPDAQIGLMTRTLLSRPNLEKIARNADLDIRAQDTDALEDLLNSLQSTLDWPARDGKICTPSPLRIAIRKWLKSGAGGRHCVCGKSAGRNPPGYRYRPAFPGETDRRV